MARLRPKAERMKTTNGTSTSSSTLRQGSSPVTPTATEPMMKVEPDDAMVPVGDALSSDTKQRQLSPKESSGSEVPTPKNVQTAHSMASDSLAPFAVLRKSATAGNFTIANILNVDDESSVGEESSHLEVFRQEHFPTKDPNDPVNRSLINMPMAQGLFDKYVGSVQPINTHPLLAAAAKVFSPHLYVRLHDHVEFLLSDILGSGQKSTEIVQGICLVTHWKEPSDSRAWMLVGYAIRACIEMGWHRLSPTNLDPAENGPGGHEKEMELRERRNKERTWLMLFVYDRSVSLQLGRPSMIPIDSLIRNVETWHQHPHATPGIDEVMVAFVQLRTLGFDLLDVFWLHPVATTLQAIEKDEFILKTFNSELDRWEGKWHRILEEAFNPEWKCFSPGAVDLLLKCPRNAADSVHVMVAYAAVVTIKVSSTLRRRRNAAYTYTLAQILLSMPGVLSPDSESAILDLIHEASEYFGRQCSASNTSCFYQSRFLANVEAQYRKSKAKANIPTHNLIKQQYDGQPLQDGYIKPPMHARRPPLARHHQAPQHPQNQPSLPLPSPAHYPSQDGHDSHPCLANDTYPPCTTTPPPPPPPPPLPMQFAASNDLFAQQHPHLSQPDTNQLTTSVLHATITATTNSMPHMNHPNPNTAEAILASNAPPSTPISSNNNTFEPMISISEGPNAGDGGGGNHYAFASFTDNGAWENLFAHAGFNINSGAFLPNLEEQ
ncbi:hypothetical protein PRK78_002503 [Emydomyces testavorans]|uniref:Xylanolytic transcriptional activator regulatory domain-containing protein n=1 Tax=Emydomyces testavorans TaxID=2070801 RepID=A0AAF0IJQ6_9EURO|nr:hypothetical protein PRK78_002503 [Emydomyces testavorans]